MKNLKFRIWDTLENKMITPPTCSIGFGSGAQNINIGLDGKITLSNAWGLPDGTDPTEIIEDRFTIIQFIGSHRINGSELWAGDIFELTLNGIETHIEIQNAVVEFNDNALAYAFKVLESSSDYKWLGLNDKNILSIKHLGNIHEDPNLLDQ